MTIYKRIKKTVTALDAAQMYGLNVRSNGMTNCPFHEDHNPSLKLDRYFYCFGCHAHGDVIDFVSRLFGISRYDAAQKIAVNFGIYPPPPSHPNPIKDNAEQYPLCVQHGLRYLVCPYFRDVVIHNNADLMEELLEIPKNTKLCRECRKFFVPTHRNSLYCPICREKIAAEKALKRSQKYRDQKKVNRHDC